MKKKPVIMMYYRVGKESQLQGGETSLKSTGKMVHNLFKRTKKC